MDFDKDEFLARNKERLEKFRRIEEQVAEEMEEIEERKRLGIIPSPLDATDDDPDDSD